MTRGSARVEMMRLRCAFCDSSVVVFASDDEVDPKMAGGIVHELPACSRFLSLDAAAFLRATVDAILKARASGAS
jgi:hypothetical protein